MNTSTGQWQMQAGEPAEFSFALGFARNPHGDADRAALEERESWGFFSIWAGGENLCAHVEQGETLDSAHWYMISLIEWFAANWDPLLHEEKLPLRNLGTTAAQSLSRTRTVPPISVRPEDEFEWLNTWSAWWQRHCIRAGTEGGIFPDLHIRRSRDALEISTGGEPVPDVPDHVYFLTPNREHRVDPLVAASALYEVLTAATRELGQRMPGSERVGRLAGLLRALRRGRRDSRMAWAVGLGENPARYAELAAAVDTALDGVGGAVRETLTGAGRSSELVLYGTPTARLLYGALSPDMSEQDVRALVPSLAANYVPDAADWLDRLHVPKLVELESRNRQLPPGEQGAALGERACELLEASVVDGYVDVHGVFSSLGIDKYEIALSDPAVRGISIFGPTQRPWVVCSTTTTWGTSAPVERFTLAHELCHLLLDREWGEELAVASGPWAPVAIEQRANAFAAAFLLPSWLLRSAVSSLTEHVAQPASITRLARRLQVSRTALISRLYNLGELSAEDHEHLTGAT